MHRLPFLQTVMAIAILSFVPWECSAQQVRRVPMAWDTCTFIEDTRNACTVGEKPRKFDEYLHTAWVRQAAYGFLVESKLDRIQPNENGFKATWREIAVLGTSRIREVSYFLNDVEMCAKVLSAERKHGLFAPLLKWCGDLPEPVLYRFGGSSVLVIARDFGGNIPMVQTWAWTETVAGPILLDIEQARNDAIQKVAPGHGSYSTFIDWDTLHTRTYAWTGEWPGKGGVHETVDIWFDFKDAKLIPNRVELSESDHETKHWP
jgi:hypothetical protein